ncbi:hypothetical protein CEPID_00400 [Corynebacterium epidermidicanis]|uniref:Uncharacterized protein n=1 Tax=Corynebacterium epidermidicanis TaxID=1050174 RepID=A0A0G3GLD6_9CORY|nr:hypothetical protein CEPID_00400 [Corynebacterium epidermidicanis]
MATPAKSGLIICQSNPRDMSISQAHLASRLPEFKRNPPSGSSLSTSRLPAELGEITTGNYRRPVASALAELVIEAQSFKHLLAKLLLNLRGQVKVAHCCFKHVLKVFSVVTVFQ